MSLSKRIVKVVTMDKNAYILKRAMNIIKIMKTRKIVPEGITME